MPHRKRRHGRNKNSKEKGETPKTVPETSRFESQPVTPTSTPQVSTVKPAQYEKGSKQSFTAAAASKPGTTPTSGAGGAAGTATTQKGSTQSFTAAAASKPGTTPTSGAGGAAGTATTQKGSTQSFTTAAASKPGTTPTSGAGGAAGTATTQKGSTQSFTAAAASKPGTTPTSGAGGAAGTATIQKGTTQVTQQATVYKPTSSSTANTPPVSSGTTGAKSTDPAKDKAQSTTTPSSKPEPAKVDPVVGKPSVPATLPGSGLKEKSGQKVQVEVGPSAPKVSAEADPFDALGDLLPSSQPVAPKVPKYTGPEVKETNIKPDKGVLCGERDSTLPPGYRWEDLEKKKPSGVPEKPKDVPKPISTDEALDSLSAGFVSAPPPSAPKKTEPKTETIGAVDAKSAGFSSFTPPPSQQKQQATTAGVTKSSAPPADKKAKIETPSEKPTLAAGKSSTPAQPAKPKTDVPDSSIPSDALSALGDMLGDAEPPKKQPELKPGNIVDEKKVKSEKGVRVGERDDTLPPDYRFSEEELKKLPPPPKEPSMDTDDALDILSGGFETPAAAPVVKAAVPPSAPSAQDKKKPAAVPEKAKEVPKPKVDELSALDALAGDFVAPPKAAPKVSSAVPSGPKPKAPTDEDAFNALGDMLGAPEPPKKQPELKPKDIVNEKDVTSKKGVRVGERDDTLPPDYRFSEEELKKHPAPPKEPSLDTDAALDLLSGDFKSPSAPPAPKPPVCTAAKPPAKPSDDFDALDALADDFVAPSSASKVHSAVSGPTHATRKLSEGSSSALDALSDTLADIKPAPEPAPVPPKKIVKEKDIVEERVSKPGERDDTLPPDNRFTEADKKAFAEAKEKGVKPKQGSMDDTAALDLLSSDFSKTPTVKASAPEAHTFKPEPTPPTHTPPGPALDELATNLIPDLEKSSKAKGKGGKPKSKSKKHSGEDSSAVEHMSGQLSSTNVVPSSSSKSGKR